MCVVLNVFCHRPLSAPEGPFAEHREEPREGAQEEMFWELVLGDAPGEPVKSQCPKVMIAWKRRKHKIEKASRWPWIEYEHSPRAMQLESTH